MTIIYKVLDECHSIDLIPVVKYIPLFEYDRKRNNQVMNMLEQVADLYKTLGQPARLSILLAIGSGEACVCHLEAALKFRQAYISQHLMALREAGLVDSRRDGRNIYYRLRDPGMLDVIRATGDWLVKERNFVETYAEQTAVLLQGCSCPRCSTDANPVSSVTLGEISLYR